MEVFIPYDGSEEAIPFLDMALRAWEKVRFAQPSVIGLAGSHKNNIDIRFRVCADNLAKGDFYVLADVDAVPEERYVISQIQKHLAVSPRVGIALIRPVFELGGRVRVVRKGAVSSWPQKVSTQYDQEHAEAMISAGYTFETWDVCYRPVPSLVIN